MGWSDSRPCHCLHSALPKGSATIPVAVRPNIFATGAGPRTVGDVHPRCGVATPAPKRCPPPRSQPQAVVTESEAPHHAQADQLYDDGALSKAPPDRAVHPLRTLDQPSPSLSPSPGVGLYDGTPISLLHREGGE